MQSYTQKLWYPVRLCLGQVIKMIYDAWWGKDANSGSSVMISFDLSSGLTILHS